MRRGRACETGLGGQWGPPSLRSSWPISGETEAREVRARPSAPQQAGGRPGARTSVSRPHPRPGGEMKSLSFQPQPARPTCVTDALSRPESWPPPSLCGSLPTPHPTISVPSCRGVSWFLGSQAWRLRPGAPPKPAAAFLQRLRRRRGPAVGRCLPCSVPQFPHL